MARRRSGGAEVVTIFWRDIPAQVNGQDGRDRHQVLLSSKFQRAVDRAKRKAGIYTAEDDITQDAAAIIARSGVGTRCRARSPSTCRARSWTSSDGMSIFTGQAS